MATVIFPENCTVNTWPDLPDYRIGDFDPTIPGCKIYRTMASGDDFSVTRILRVDDIEGESGSFLWRPAGQAFDFYRSREDAARAALAFASHMA